MAICVQTFFSELIELSTDKKKGPPECERLLNLLNRNLSESQVDKFDLGKCPPFKLFTS